MYQAIVVGAGHAGCEACFVLAKKGFKTALLTLDLEHIAKMPCNPSVGGPAKGIVVREIDAFGGLMPKVADETAIQFKLLNSSKGPGVRALRVQSDKLAYSKKMYEHLKKLENLDILQGQVTDLVIEENSIKGVFFNGKKITSQVVILTTGTYMNSLTMISNEVKNEGPDGEKTTKNLSESLKSAGIKLFRLKTGTPPRILTSSINFSKTKYEPGTKGQYRFSEESDFNNLLPFEKQLPCYLTHTTLETKKIIEENLSKSSMYSGVVKGVGPRYCPSIEDKVVRFNDKQSHQIFLEPESLDLNTTYVQGFSSSLPKDVQEKMLKTITGLEDAVIEKYAYAIEYDAIDPFEVKFNLETRKINNLFVAGQILGTSGYEEAAGLGLMAGINACLKLEGQKPFILSRDEAYIGVMIDDLITKGTKEPYRLLTSRAEYRLLLRHDNADQRLIEYANKFHLVSNKRYEEYCLKIEKIKQAKEYLKSYMIKRHGVFDEYLSSIGQQFLTMGQSLYDLLKRPEIKLSDIIRFIPLEIEEKYFEQLEIEIKYEGYIIKALKDAKRLKKLEKMKLPTTLDYDLVPNLALEAKSKLNKIKPENFSQASRISGVNPSDLEVLAIFLKERKNED